MIFCVLVAVVGAITLSLSRMSSHSRYKAVLTAAVVLPWIVCIVQQLTIWEFKYRMEEATIGLARMQLVSICRTCLKRGTHKVPQLRDHATKVQDIRVFAHECQVEVLEKLNESLYEVILSQVKISSILPTEARADG